MHPIEESNNAPLNIPASSTTKIINDKEDYDDALDEGPILPKNSPCLEISTNLYEDKMMNFLIILLLMRVLLCF